MTTEGHAASSTATDRREQDRDDDRGSQDRGGQDRGGQDHNGQAQFDTILLLAHGSTKDGRASRRLRAIARELDRLHPTVRVGVAFWKEEPAPADALQWLEGRRTFVIPVLMGDGYFYRDAFPKLLNSYLKTGTAGTVDVVMGEPVGESDVFIDALHEVVSAALIEEPHDSVSTPQTPRHEQPKNERPKTVVIVGHGTSRSARSRDTVHRVTDRLRASYEGLTFNAAFIDDEPCLDEAIKPLRGSCVVVPWFLTDGPHSVHDITEAVTGTSGDRRAPGEEESRRLPNLSVKLLPAIGETTALASALARMVLEITSTDRTTPPDASKWRRVASELLAEHTTDSGLKLGSLRITRQNPNCADSFMIETIPRGAVTSNIGTSNIGTSNTDSQKTEPQNTQCADATAELRPDEFVEQVEERLVGSNPVPRATLGHASTDATSTRVSREELLDLIEYFYPSALLWAAQSHAGVFDVNPAPTSSAWWNTTVGRLPGHLSRKSNASRQERSAAYEATCCATGCLRTPIFIETSKREDVVAGSGVFPLLCARPCHAFLGNVSIER